MTVQIDLTGERAVSIGATYKVVFQLCNAPDLTEYLGSCQVRPSVGDLKIIISPDIEVINKDTFSLTIPFSDFTAEVLPGNFVYDVLFISATDRFYAISGKIALVRRVTQAL